MTNYTTHKKDRCTVVKQGRRKVFEVVQLRNGDIMSFDRTGLGLVTGCKSVQQCIDESFSRMEMLRIEFNKRLVK